jgi:hypothetical protein
MMSVCLARAVLKNGKIPLTLRKDCANLSNTMKGMRHIKKPGRACLLVLALVLLRGLVPAGFMLAPVDGHLAFVLCDADVSMPAMAAGAMPAGHDHMHMAMGDAAHGHGAHGDPTCPYAQSGGAAPLPTLPVLAGGTTFERPQLPAAITQTLLGFGPIRQPSSRGPPHLA